MHIVEAVCQLNCITIILFQIVQPTPVFTVTAEWAENNRSNANLPEDSDQLPCLCCKRPFPQIGLYHKGYIDLS